MRYFNVAAVLFALSGFVAAHSSGTTSSTALSAAAPKLAQHAIRMLQRAAESAALIALARSVPTLAIQWAKNAPTQVWRCECINAFVSMSCVTEPSQVVTATC